MYIPYLVHTAHFWNNLHQKYSQKDLEKAKIRKFSGVRKQNGLNMITKVG